MGTNQRLHCPDLKTDPVTAFETTKFLSTHLRQGAVSGVRVVSEHQAAYSNHGFVLSGSLTEQLA